MTIKELNIKELKEYENNPRYNDKAVEKVAASIQEFGFKVPIVIDKDNVIIAGHTRLKAAELLGLDNVPCIVADDLTPAQVKAFRLADNKTSEFADWDFEKLDEELDELLTIDFDMERFGFEAKADDEENPYTTKVEIPAYQPMEDEAPPIDYLFDDAKTVELQQEIEAADIPEDVKAFLMLAAYRHTVFDYGQIAEYYCHAPAEIQDLMEKSALVIIDFDKAIEYGYTNLKNELNEMLEQDKEYGDE